MGLSYGKEFADALKKYGVTPKKEYQNMSGMIPDPYAGVSNDIDTWVRSLPKDMDDTALATYVYSNADLKNADSRKTATDWYKKIYGLDKEETELPLPPLSDTIGGMSGGMNEGQVRQHLKGLGYDSTDISDGWKLYNSEYGYDPKKASQRAQNLAVRFPGRDSPIFDAWLDEIEDGKSKGYLTPNDLNWLLSMAEGWGSYYG